MVFQIEDIHKSFGKKQVLKGIDFSAQSGQAFGLLGRNGAGKTTTIRIIMNVFPADSGSVLLDGAPFSKSGLQIGYLPEEHGLYPKIKVREQLIYLAELRGVSGKKAKQSIDYWVARLGMQEYANRKLDTLSKGNQQKIQLVAALMADPAMVILDEPFSGLDPVNAALLKDVVKELIEKGKIVLFSSHQMSYVEEFCDAIAILHEGKIALSGSIQQIKRSYDRRTLVVRSLQPGPLLDFANGTLGGYLQSAEMRKNQVFLHMKEENCKAQVIEILAKEGPEIDSVAVYEPSLNDIFVQTAGDDNETKGGEAV
ncbi:ATP-binding cassette domain-containing protein [Ruminococcaceae bacterium OttesenSCG-928-I18]|nr:ATP-binding cassette domain-containing protein [Ruminococcaceae bacterium OttesenSCG-928-I18]